MTCAKLFCARREGWPRAVSDVSEAQHLLRILWKLITTVIQTTSSRFLTQYKAGYGATPRSIKDSAAATKAGYTSLPEKAVKQKRIELISSMAFAISTVYLAMGGEMIGAPVPPAVSGMNGMMNLATELHFGALFCLFVATIFVGGFRSLLHGALIWTRSLR